MATITSKANGAWSTGSTWSSDPAIPVNGDVVIVAHDVTDFDVDMSAWANGITLTINVGKSLTVKDDAGAYYLKSNAADITVNGNWMIGTSVAVPFTGTLTVDFNGAAKSIEVSATGHLYWYCEQPTNLYIMTTEAGGVGEGTVADPLNVDTNVTADWVVGQQVRIIDSTPLNTELFTLSAINAESIEIGAVGLAAAKSTDSMVMLITRNIRIINVAASDYAITYGASAGSGDYLGVEINNCYRGVNRGAGFEFAGTCELLTTSPYCFYTSVDSIMSGALAGPSSGTRYGLLSCGGFTVSGVIAGFTSGSASGIGNTIDGYIFGCTNGLSTPAGEILSSTGIIKYCSNGISQGSAVIYGDILSCATTVHRSVDIIFANSTLSGVNFDLRECLKGVAYNTVFSAPTEFYNYNSTASSKMLYFESFDHDGVTNAFVAWCRGGIVTSQTALPPTGYTIWYEHACEYVAAGSYPCFRQYDATVLPGTAIEVHGKIRIADGEDLSADPPALQIIDKFADPLVDSTQTPLDEDEVADATGVTTDWQDVDVIWANAGDSPRRVIVRMYASVAGAVANVDVDECWSIANYQTQIQAIYDKLPTNYIMGSSDVDNHDTDIDSILADTNEIQGKLPDDYIMGSSVTTSMDDEIDAIIAITGQVHTVDDETPGGGTAGTSGIAEGC